MDLQDKTVIITGGNSGIGFYTALDLAKRGAVVTILGRNEETCKSSVEMIKTETRNQNVSYQGRTLQQSNKVHSRSITTRSILMSCDQ